MTPHWSLKGTYAEACTCDAPCPCTMLSDPTEGTCTALVGWQVTEGEFDGLSLAGLNVAMAVHTPGNMADGDWRAALYLDERASPEQQEALGKIFGGQAGGHPAELVGFVGEVAGVQVAPVTIETDGRGGRFRIGEVGAADWAPIEGQEGRAPTIHNHPLAIAPGFPAMVGRTREAAFRDLGIEFHTAGRNAMVSPFAYAGP